MLHAIEYHAGMILVGRATNRASAEGGIGLLQGSRSGLIGSTGQSGNQPKDAHEELEGVVSVGACSEAGATHSKGA